MCACACVHYVCSSVHIKWYHCCMHVCMYVSHACKCVWWCVHVYDEQTCLRDFSSWSEHCLRTNKSNNSRSNGVVMRRCSRAGFSACVCVCVALRAFTGSSFLWSICVRTGVIGVRVLVCVCVLLLCLTWIVVDTVSVLFVVVGDVCGSTCREECVCVWGVVVVDVCDRCTCGCACWDMDVCVCGIVCLCVSTAGVLIMMCSYLCVVMWVSAHNDDRLVGDWYDMSVLCAGEWCRRVHAYICMYVCMCVSLVCVCVWSLCGGTKPAKQRSIPELSHIVSMAGRCVPVISVILLLCVCVITVSTSLSHAAPSPSPSPPVAVGGRSHQHQSTNPAVKCPSVFLCLCQCVCMFVLC